MDVAEILMSLQRLCHEVQQQLFKPVESQGFVWLKSKPNWLQ
jgi:hypothetical protein